MDRLIAIGDIHIAPQRALGEQALAHRIVMAALVEALPVQRPAFGDALERESCGQDRQSQAAAFGERAG